MSGSADNTYRGEDAPEVGEQATCRCGGNIEWRLRPTIPFPEVATERQLKRSGKGRWVHVSPSGTDAENEWCPRRKAMPA